MLSQFQARAERRVLFSAGLVGAGVGLALGAAYMAGGMASAATAHARAERLTLAATSNLLPASGPAAEAQVLRLSDQLRPEQPAPGTPEARAQQRKRDLDCLTDAVYFEARGETPKGQAAVATVVMNRVKNARFPKTVCGVVFQRAAGHGCQFSFACDGSMRQGREDGAWDRARHVAARTLAGVLLRDVGSATHFHNADVAPDWGPQMLRVAQVGLHIFYRPNPHARTPVDDAPEPALQVEQASYTPAKDAAPTLKLASQTNTAPAPPAQAQPAPPAAKPAPEPAKPAPAAKPADPAPAKSTETTAS